ncbi:DJ-1/PfpI family protein [Kitasatospora sp. NPDC048296]|uniref:DJ-1/PfpI family protein n=1 Tax=Kitasatospora sp. NPDC048296 TaxID=3364048 RepID=UPI00372467C2
MPENTITQTDTLDFSAGRRRPRVAMLVFPGMTLLDFVGPHTAWAPYCDIDIVWETLDPVATDTGLTVVPTTTFDDCPADLDVLFVPGGAVHTHALRNDTALAFLADRGARAGYVTSVCTGSLLLGAAGLLRGYRAATHWATRDLLTLVGAVNSTDRVVIDRNRITGGGVTAGIDFGLTLLARMLDEEAAQVSQLAMEYHPAPPYEAGSPEQAPSSLVQAVTGMLADFSADLTAVLKDVASAGALRG